MGSKRGAQGRNEHGTRRRGRNESGTSTGVSKEMGNQAADKDVHIVWHIDLNNVEQTGAQLSSGI